MPSNGSNGVQAKVRFADMFVASFHLKFQCLNFRIVNKLIASANAMEMVPDETWLPILREFNRFSANPIHQSYEFR